MPVDDGFRTGKWRRCPSTAISARENGFDARRRRFPLGKTASMPVDSDFRTGKRLRCPSTAISAREDGVDARRRHSEFNILSYRPARAGAVSSRGRKEADHGDRSLDFGLRSDQGPVPMIGESSLECEDRTNAGGARVVLSVALPVETIRRARTTSLDGKLDSGVGAALGTRPVT